jgi:ankyrin repeat protein
VNAKIATPLNVALTRAYYGETFEQCKKVALLLLSHKADPNLPDSDVFSKAVSIGDIDLVNMLLSNGLNPDIVNTPIIYNRTPLIVTPLIAAINLDDRFWSSDRNMPDYKATVFSLVLSKSTNVNQQNSQGLTALMFAAVKGHEEFVQKLLNAGANKNLKDKAGRTALDYAVLEGHIKVIKILQ